MHSGTWWSIARAVICAVVGLFLIAPMVIVVIISFSSAQFLTFPPPGWSLQWYRKLLTDPAWFSSLITSVEVVTSAGILATMLGTAAAYGLSRGNLRGSSLITSLLMAPVVVPVIITAAGMYGVFRTWGLDGTLWGLIIADTVLTVPYVLTTVMASLKVVDKNLESAALTLGATRWKAFWWVVFPLALPGVLAGSLFAMVIAFDELIVSMFISTPLVRPVTVQMWSNVRGDVDPTIAAVGSVIFGVSIGTLLADFIVRRFTERRVRRRSAFAWGARRLKGKGRSPQVENMMPRWED